MIDFKKIIADIIYKIANINIEEIYDYIEIPKDEKMGDYAFPCFKLSKQLKQAPQVIANNFLEKINYPDENIEKVIAVGGYLNFFVNKEKLITEVINEFKKNEAEFGSSKVGQGKNIVIDYSSPNIAKPFHIGHLRSTVIGGALYNIYKFLGYNVIGVNHIGDYGTQFGKLIEGYKRWGNEYNLEENPIDVLTEIYIRINELCEKDESVLEQCRTNFKLLEQNDEYCKALWEKFKELSIEEFKKVYNLFNCKFDSWDGESFYIDKMDEIVDMLNNTGLLVESQGAKIINLDDKNMAPCLIKKSNGSSTYATRDLAAILYRARTYDYEKAIYVTSYEQILHFNQVFEVAKLLPMDNKYKEGLVHVPFGMVLLKEGKMSTRKGSIIKLEDLINEGIKKAKKIIEEKNPSLENKEEIAKKVGVGAIIFNDLANGRIKDEIFDWDEMLSFNGETGPYIQYIYVRTNSIINKAKIDINSIKNIDTNCLNDAQSIAIIKMLYRFNDIVKLSAEKYEPSIISRYLLDIAKLYSNFYQEKRIIGEEENIKLARLYLTYMVNQNIKKGLELIGIDVPEKM